MSKMKSYAESVLFQSIISLSEGTGTVDSLAALSENYISRLGSSDVPIPLRKALNDVKGLLAALIEKNYSQTGSHAAWMSKKQCLLTLITELYTDVVAWNAVEQYISASQFLLFSEGKNGSERHSHNAIN
ncbi:hypothetical protein G7090_03010 [Leclercia sp. 29361]|uniref:hypothetical protein n=1 Tax=Leclercia sp. 29361 TaxID=2714951 RepID=UPI0014085D8C|nr:hypothetical protein [Leclercia sp. 29361]QIK12402.1 hypothetical protein G7090_03010 [Leclercia sp. 29361]